MTTEKDDKIRVYVIFLMTVTVHKTYLIYKTRAGYVTLILVVAIFVPYALNRLAVPVRI